MLEVRVKVTSMSHMFLDLVVARASKFGNLPNLVEAVRATTGQPTANASNLTFPIIAQRGIFVCKPDWRLNQSFTITNLGY